jgi:succinate dehydrogenase flavin-adding protein (antitoxin of CptAB toxin-antitoxin module)
MTKLEHVEYVNARIKELNDLCTDIYEAMMDMEDKAVIDKCVEMQKLIKQIQIEYTDETLLQ